MAKNQIRLNPSPSLDFILRKKADELGISISEATRRVLVKHFLSERAEDDDKKGNGNPK